MLKEFEKENAADQHRLVLLFCASSELKMDFQVIIQKCPLITIPPPKFRAQDLKLCSHRTKARHRYTHRYIFYNFDANGSVTHLAR